MSKTKKKTGGSQGATTRIDQQTDPSSSVSNPPESEFLRDEYSALVSLYSHTENTLFSIFNYYLTLLSTITGALIVLTQLNSANLTVALGPLCLLLILVILLSIITQDAIVNKNVDLAHYALAINLVKAFALRHNSELKHHIFYMRVVNAEVGPMLASLTFVDRWQQRLRWILPLGTHQLFVGLMNSFALAAITFIVSIALSPVPISLLQTSLVSGLVVIVALTVNCIYAQLEYRRKSAKANVTMNGTNPEWITTTQR